MLRESLIHHENSRAAAVCSAEIYFCRGRNSYKNIENREVTKSFVEKLRNNNQKSELWIQRWLLRILPLQSATCQSKSRTTLSQRNFD